MATSNESLFCPITLGLFNDPVVAQDGHTYEREAIIEWIRQHGTSPMTRQPLSFDHLYSNRTVKELIDSFEKSARKKKYEFTLNVDVRKRESRPLFQTYGKSIYHAQWLPTNDNRPEIILLKIDGARANKEASFYVDLSRHPRIVRTFGFVYDNDNNVDQNAVMLLQEYAPEGSLYEQLQERAAILNEDVLIEIFLQIIDAMIYLVFNNVVHGDLACRNVLVFRFDDSNPKNNVVKITDFGLSRHSQLYSLQPGAAQTIINIIPTRYVAPEIFSANATHGAYSEKSDIYSMGVLMWEAYSRGAIPWSNTANDEDVIRHVLNGNHLPQPSNCSQEYWNIILKTWARLPNDRPTFQQLQHLLNEHYYQRGTGTKSKIEAYPPSTSKKSSTVQITTLKKPQEFAQPIFEKAQGVLEVATETLGSVSDTISKKVSSFINMSHKSKTTAPIGHQNRQLEQQIAQLEIHSEINLDEQQLTDQNMEIVVREAINNKQCAQLFLRKNHITPIGAVILADALRNNNTLKELYLTHNQISDKGMKALAQALETNNHTITQLELGGNRITDKGAHYLAEMLKTNTKLLRLGLFNNEIGDRGVQLLAKALETHNKTLQELCLDDNTLVSDWSVDSLVDMIKRNQSLKELLVYRCGLSQRGIKRLRKAAEGKRDFELFCE